MRAFFCNSGAESIECAIKLARRHAGRQGTVIAAEGSFHGRTFGALAATGQRGKQKPFDPMLPGFRHVPFGDLGALRDAVDESVIAILLEPVQGEGGVIPAPPGYLAGARALCDELEALLVFDEVQTAMGRTGAWFAHELFGVRPDVMCLAKGLAGGLPIGACLAVPQVAESFRPGDHASTFGGGPVQCSAALAVIEVIEDEGLLERSTVLGARLLSGLEQVFGPATVRGLGLMLAVDLGSRSARDICGAALGKGLLINDVGPHVLRFTPPLVISEADVDEGIEILKEVVREVEAA
jgi:acetylornithine aminotransferase